MAGDDFKVQYNPFAYQSVPIDSVTTAKPHSQEQQVKPPKVAEFGFATRPQQKAYAENSGNVDPNFVKNTFAYLPYTTSPVSKADYDDSDYRGRGIYCCA